MTKNKRYIKLESVGSVIDKYTLDILPLALDGKIMFSERHPLKDVTNPDWVTSLSKNDKELLYNTINAHIDLATNAHVVLIDLTKNK